MENMDQYTATEQQQDAIKQEIAAEQPLVSDLADVDSLRPLLVYPAFVAKLQELCDKYAHIRQVRGDGNCFYRAYAVSLLEYVAKPGNEDAAQRLLTVVTDSMQFLLAQGLPEFAVEDFWCVIKDEVSWIVQSKPPVEEVAKRLQDQSTSDYIVMYLRLVTSAYLKANAESYTPYLEGNYVTMDAFCQGEVDPMGKDAQHLQCVALTSYTQFGVRIEYMDQSEGAINHHDFPSDGSSEPSLFLLYRPGHYDILYQ